MTGAVDSVGETHEYRISLAAGEAVEYAVADTGETRFQPQVWVRSPSGVRGNWTFGETGSTQRFTAAETGVYRFEVSAYAGQGSATGAFALTVVRAPGEQHDPDGRQLLSGQMVERELRLGDIDVFTIDAVAQASLVVSVGAQTPVEFFDPRVRVLGPDGKQVGEGASVVARVSAAGRYTVVVKDLGADVAGGYRLAAVTVPGSQFDAEGGSLGDGIAVDRMLRVGDIDVFTLSGEAGETGRFSLTDRSGSADFQPQIQLFSPVGERVATLYEQAQGTVELSYRFETGGGHFLTIADRQSLAGGGYRLVPTGIRGAPGGGERALSIGRNFGSGSVVLQWDGGGTLMVSDDLKQWSAVPGATSPHQVSPGAGGCYYQLLE